MQKSFVCTYLFLFYTLSQTSGIQFGFVILSYVEPQ